MFKFNSNAFATPISQADHSVLINKIAEKIIQRHMAVPAILFLETFKPLNRIMSQLIIVASPFAAFLFSYKDINDFSDMLQNRENIERLIEQINLQKNAIHKPSLNPEL